MPKTPMGISAAQRSRRSEASNKQIQGTVIFGRFIAALTLPPTMNLKTKMIDKLKGGLVKWDLGLELMRYGPFKTDGLVLQKDDVMNATTFEDLGNLVFAWYRANDWQVV